MTRVLYSPPRLKKKKNRFVFFRRVIFWKVALSFLILGGIFYFIFLASYFQIKEIKISGIETVSEDALRKELDRILLEKKYFFLSKNNLFLFSSKEAERALLEEFPKIKEISFNKNFLSFRKLSFSKQFLNSLFRGIMEAEIREREMAAVWCGSTSSPQDCFFIDGGGVIFEEFPQSSGFLLFKINDFRPIREIKLGAKIFEKEYLSQLLDLKENLERNLGIGFPELTILEEGTLEAKSSRGWKIIFEIEKDLVDQVEAIKKILQEMKPEEREKLEYFDLRVSGRIYYK